MSCRRVLNNLEYARRCQVLAGAGNWRGIALLIGCAQRLSELIRTALQAIA